VEQKHIADALTFELSKVETPRIRERMLSHLQNIDEDLAAQVAEGLGIEELPEPAPPMVKPRKNLPKSDALSILKNGPDSFEGRKLGILVTDGIDAGVLTALQAAAEGEGAVVELVAPTIGGIKTSGGDKLPAHHKIDGGPSVLFDAVAIIASNEGIAAMLAMPPARDFVADAFAHYKFVAYNAPAKKLFAAAGVKPDDGFVDISNAGNASDFIARCRELRFWERVGGA
jgi:catalase